MTDRDDDSDWRAKRAKDAARKVRKEAEDAAEAAIAQDRHAAQQAFEAIKVSRARAGTNVW